MRGRISECVRLRRWVCVLGVVFAVSGCRVGPDYVEPEVAVPDMWQQEVIREFETGEGDLHRWWTVFDDPLLAGLIERARLGNLDLQSAMWRMHQSRAILGVISGAKFPEINAVGEYKRNRISEGISESIFPPTDRTDNFYRLGFDSFWEVDFWGRIARSVASARADLQASVEEVRDVQVLLYAETASAYVDVRALQERIRLAEGNVLLQTQTLQLTRDRFEADLTGRLDVEQAELNLAVTKAAIPQLKSQLARSIHRLGVLLGDFPTALYAELTQEGEIPLAKVDVATGVPADLLRQRPDIRRAERELAAQTEQIGVATSELYPRFVINGTISLQAVNTRLFPRSGSIAYSFGPEFRWTLFAGGRIRSQVALEEFLTEETLTDYEQVILLALEEVENAMVDYVQEVKRNEELAESVRAAAESVKLVKTLYLIGLTDFENVLVMQRSLFEQEDELANSTGLVSKNLIRLYKALGGGWQANG